MRGNEVLVLILELLARLVWPGLQDRLARWATALLPDLPLLSGHWLVQFEDASAKRTRPTKIDADLRQFGRHVSGIGHIHGASADVFRFEGTIKRNVFIGTFARKDAHVLAGTGNFLLKVRADSRRLSGHCMWFDGRLEDVWVSKYEWNR